MKPRLLVIIESDPRTSPRPAEAVRIAAGIGAWKKIHVDLFLSGPAQISDSGDTELLIDGENFAEHLSIVRESGGKVFTASEVGVEEIAKQAAAATTVLHF